MTDFRLAEAAEADIVDILIWSESRFGLAARVRYQRLIATALNDIAADPFRPGSIARPELGKDARSWHLRGSREKARDAEGLVRRPRHLLLYRPTPGLILIGRVLYDAMELERHLPGAPDWS